MRLVRNAFLDSDSTLHYFAASEADGAVASSTLSRIKVVAATTAKEYVLNVTIHVGSMPTDHLISLTNQSFYMPCMQLVTLVTFYSKMSFPRSKQCSTLPLAGQSHSKVISSMTAVFAQKLRSQPTHFWNVWVPSDTPHVTQCVVKSTK